MSNKKSDFSHENNTLSEDQVMQDRIVTEFLKEAEEIEAQLGGPGAEEDYKEDPAAKEAMWNRIVAQLRAEGIYEEPAGDAAASTTETGGHAAVERVPAAGASETGGDISGSATARAAATALAAREAGADSVSARRSARAAFAFKWVAIVAITLVGIFGVTLTSSANRQYWWEKVEGLFGNGDSIGHSNSEKHRVYADEVELETVAEIEAELGILMPKLYYHPEGDYVINYEVYKDISSFLITYQYEDTIMFFEGWGASGDVSMANNIDKSEEGEIYNYNDVEYKICKSDEEDSNVTFINWEYDNCEFIITCSFPTDEIKKIIENIWY